MRMLLNCEIDAVAAGVDALEEHALVLGGLQGIEVESRGDGILLRFGGAFRQPCELRLVLLIVGVDGAAAQQLVGDVLAGDGDRVLIDEE